MRVTLPIGPAIVDVDVAIAGILQPELGELVGDSANHGLVEFVTAPGGIPVVETHLRRRCDFGGTCRKRGPLRIGSPRHVKQEHDEWNCSARYGERMSIKYVYFPL